MDSEALDKELRWLGNQFNGSSSLLIDGKNDHVDLCVIPDDAIYSSLLLRTPVDPGNLNFYPPNRHCQKVIKAVTPGSKLVLTFNSGKFYIEDSEGCIRDYLIIEDAVDASYSVRCCGNRCGNINVSSDFAFISKSGSIRLTFVSDHVIQKVGFMAQLAETIKLECKGEPNMLATTQQVTALHTNSSSDCVVTINGVNHDDVLRIEFQRFRLPYSGPNCIYDRLEFEFDYAPENASNTKAMCGIQSGPEFIINANKVRVRYVNDLSRLTGIFSFQYFSINERFWVTLRQPYYYHAQERPLSILVHEMEPNQRCSYSLKQTDDIVVTFYEFKFRTEVGRRLSATVTVSLFDNTTSASTSTGAMVYFSDRFLCTTPSQLLGIQERYVYSVPLDPVTMTGSISTQSFEMMIYVATFGDKLQKSVRLEVFTEDLEIYAGHLDLPVRKGAEFYLKNSDLIDHMQKLSMQLHTSQMLIGAPRTHGISHVYWNITSFDLDRKYSDESCNKTGLFVVKRDALTIGEKKIGPFCSASSLPVSVLSQGSEVYFLLYYFHDLDVEDNDWPGENVFTYSIGAYPCEMIDLSEVESRKEFYYKECLSIISEVQVASKRNKTSVVSIRRRYANERYYTEVTLQSDCDFCATFWTLHLESECRARIPYNDIGTIGRPLQSTVEKECGIIESPGFPFPYEKYEKPIVWFFNYTSPVNLSSYYSFKFSTFDLDICSNSFLTIMERVSARVQARLNQCKNHSGSYLYTLSSNEIYIMFQANKISYNSMKASLQPRYQGFSIRFRLIKQSSKPSSDACPVPGSEDWHHRINSHAEMRDLMELILQNNSWRETVYSSEEMFVYIGLQVKSHAVSAQKCAISQTGGSSCWTLLTNSNVSRNVHDFIWSSGEPFTYQEWYPSHNDSLYSQVPRNLVTVVHEKFPQPNYYNAFLCVGMMLQNPRHHSNWV
uniref:CUB domain-containing protein n=1 Tax=Macrostomum lignano TaxID=282301 RepID=A0A1I8H5N4_9PLAT